MTFQKIVKVLNDFILLYGDRVILIITDGETEYEIKQIIGKACAKYFEPADNVKEVIITIKRK